MSAQPSRSLRVVVATALDESLCQELERLEPRLEVVRAHELQRPMRWNADWGGDPGVVRDEDEQRAFDELIDSAEVLLSLPDASPQALARTVRANPELRWVHAMAAGGGAQLRAAGLTAEELARVTVTTSAGVHGATLAEWAVFGVLAGAKNLPKLQQHQAAGEWEDRWLMRHLDEMTVLVVGLGGIGRQVARRLHAFGATVLGTTRSGQPVDGVDRLVPVDDIVSVMPEVDAVIVTLPGTEKTTGLIGRDVFAAAKPGLIVSNVGRGTVIDESALIEALDDGSVSYAALDVFATEPLPSESPLWSHPRVLVSPHTAALSAQEGARIVRLFAKNATRFLDGEEMENVVDTVEFY